MKLRGSTCAPLFAFLILAAPAWAGNNKVQVCHVPPGDPSNFHTITISENALQAHLSHGDLAGPCSAHCSQLCDDGNACTIDACDANEHCLNTHPPVNCDDGNPCTVDSCDPVAGCISTPKTCQDGNLCTVDSCDPLTGSCVFPPVVCAAGQTCNAATGSCESSVTCPCADSAVSSTFAAVLSGATPVNTCLKSVFGNTGIYINNNPGGGTTDAFSALNNRGIWSCGGNDATTSAVVPISPEQGQFCANLLEQKANSEGVTCQ